MIKLGLTGGIASGKSTVADYLRNKGIKVIDADKLSREVFNLEEVQFYLTNRFKDSIFTNGVIDRKKLAKIIFNDEDELRKYEDVIIPLIINRIKELIAFYEKEGENIVIIDAPLLFEKAKYLVDYSLLIETSVDNQISRAIKRDGFNKDEVIDRIKNQMSLDDKRKLADFIIENNSSLLKLYEKTDEVIEVLKKRRLDGKAKEK